MKIKHLLIEGYCDMTQNKKMYPCKNTFRIGIYCLNCSNFSYTQCPNEIALSNNNGIIQDIEDFIGFGGAMEPNDLQKREEFLALWRKICRKKIQEAYDEYMISLSDKN